MFKFNFNYLYSLVDFPSFMKQIKYYFSLIFILGWINALGQHSPVSAGLSAGLQNQLDQQLADRSLKGAAVSIIYPDNSIWHGSSGVSHGMVPIDNSMVFGIGSITKTLVAATVLLLQEDGLLSVTDSLHQWLPAYPNISPNITITQLLQHRSGLYNYTTNTVWGNAVNSDFSASWTADSVLMHYINAPLAAPGATFGYSNTNYLLLGRIIEEATDSTWLQVLRHRILVPHQLNSIYAEGLETRTGTFAHNWQVLSATNMVDLETALPSQKAIFTSADAAGMLASNSYDLARFAELLFEGEILEQASLNQLIQFAPIPGSLYTGYGYGIMRINYQGKQIYGHGGNIPGFSAMLLHSPVSGISVSVLINQDDDAVHLGLAMLNAAQNLLISATENIPASDFNLICYPNPNRGNGTVKFTLPQPGSAQLTIEDALGREVKMLTSGNFSAGQNSVPVSLNNLQAGLYFCKLKTETGVAIYRLIIE